MCGCLPKEMALGQILLEVMTNDDVIQTLRLQKVQISAAAFSVPLLVTANTQGFSPSLLAVRLPAIS